MKREAVLSMQDVSKCYGAGDETVVVLDKVRLDVFFGEIVAIMGASGSGKTTLLSIAGNLDHHYGGNVELLGTRLRGGASKNLDKMRRESLGFLLQRPFLIQEMTALENVMLAATLSGLMCLEAQKRAQTLLDGVRLEPHAYNKKPALLSPGQAQRVALARALVHQPRFVICDEPTASLDKTTGAAVMDALYTLVDKTQVGVLVATHDESIARRCDRVFLLEQGRLTACQGPLEP